MSDLRPNSDPQFLREQYIKSLDSAANPTQKARELADDLFSLDLTVYSSNYTFDSLIYSSMAKSIPHHLPVGGATALRRLKCRSCRATLSIIPRMLTHSHTHNTTGAIGERTSGQQRVVIRQSLMPLRFRLTQVCAAAERSGRNRCRADLGARCRVFESPHSDHAGKTAFRGGLLRY